MMKKRYKKQIGKLKGIRGTFMDTWKAIISQSYLNQNENLNDISKDNLYFQEIPLSQKYLTDIYNVSHKKIEYSNYVQISSDHINNNSLYDCFHGILFYIFYYSENKFNVNELEFHFSGGKEREDYKALITKNHVGNSPDQYDIMSIFDYSNISTQFKVNLYPYSFFGVTFKRIQINPIAYSIRSGNGMFNIPHLVSFTFEAYNEDNQKWEVLDERVNINNLISPGGYMMFYVRTVNKSYSSFQIKQIEPGHNNFWGFSVAAFDIHGIITLKDNSFSTENNSMLDLSANKIDLFNGDYFNPVLDMTYYL